MYRVHFFGEHLTHTVTLRESSEISHYRIVRQLGAGGMGVVYLAEDRRLGRSVAVKVLPSKFTRDAQRLRRFEQEARTASALNHPNIVTIYDIGDVYDTRFIVTELIEGETIRERIARSPLPAAETLGIATQVADALAAAHTAGVVHRDIKPENIMLRRDGYLRRRGPHANRDSTGVFITAHGIRIANLGRECYSIA